MIKSLGLAFVFSCAGVSMSLAAGATEPPAMAWQFAGLKAMRESGPDTVLKEIGALPKSGLLADQVRSRLTRYLPDWFELGSQQLSAELVAPLIADFLENESAARFEGDRLLGANWVVAVQLDPGSADRWKASLLTAGRRIGLGEPEPLKVEGLDGWQIPAKGSQRGFSYLTEKGWVLVASEFKAGTSAFSWATTLAKSGRPVASAGEHWLKFEIQPAAVDWNLSLPFAGKVSHIGTAWSWQSKDVRLEAKLAVADGIKLSSADWRIPKGIALDPLVSFTAVRNLHGFFSGLDPVKSLDPGLIPDQWFGWSRGTVAFIDDFAVPVADADRAFAHLQRSVPAAYNPRLTDLALGQWQVATNNPRLLWRGLPVLVPYVGPKLDSGQGFLYGGIFPLTEPTNGTPAPAELFAQFESRKDLVYYDWEITAARLAAYEQASPFISLFLPAAKAAEGSHGAAWLKELQPKLGNAVTEVTSSEPRTLNVTRRSQFGLTGIELWLLTHWLDSEKFPEFPYRKPSRPMQGSRPAGLPAPGGPGHP